MRTVRRAPGTRRSPNTAGLPPVSSTRGSRPRLAIRRASHSPQARTRAGSWLTLSCLRKSMKPSTCSRRRDSRTAIEGGPVESREGWSWRRGYPEASIAGRVTRMAERKPPGKSWDTWIEELHPRGRGGGRVRAARGGRASPFPASTDALRPRLVGEEAAAAREALDPAAGAGAAAQGRGRRSPRSGPRAARTRSARARQALNAEITRVNARVAEGRRDAPGPAGRRIDRGRVARAPRPRSLRRWLLPDDAWLPPS